MRITIPSIPPFDATWANCDNSSEDGDDDFISVFESRLEGGVEAIDFALQFEEELERELASGGASIHSASFLNASTPFFDINDLELTNINEDEDFVDEDCPPKRVRGKCREGYMLGNLFHSCWYTKFLAPDRDGIEGSRSRTRRMSG